MGEGLFIMGQIKIAIPCERKNPNNYIDAIHHLGEDAEEINRNFDIDAFDGLLLPGGYDVSPDRYGEKIEEGVITNPVLDDFQFYALDLFVKAKKPVLGICRGHQLLNVYFGGTLIQDIDSECKAVHTPEDWRNDKVHMTRTDRDSWLAKLYGKTEIITNSAHHQAVKRIGDGLEACQWGEDGLIEACFHRELPIISVQWHPERMCFDHARCDTDCGMRVFYKLLELCRNDRLQD